MTVRVEIESESVPCDRLARVRVYEDDKLVAEVIAEVEPQLGADGKSYPDVVLTKK